MGILIMMNELLGFKVKDSDRMFLATGYDIFGIQGHRNGSNHV